MPEEKEKKEGNYDKARFIRLTEDQNEELQLLFVSPLRSATNLMKFLFNNDHFYESAKYAWVDETDAKKLFFYGVCKEVLKSCVGLKIDKELLQEFPNEKEVDEITKITFGSMLDIQTYRIRKMVELLAVIILFDRNSISDKEYRIFLAAENMDLALSRQEDFRELHGKIISNTKHSIDIFNKRIKEDMQKLSVSDLWFLDKDRLTKQKPSIFKSKKFFYQKALKQANADERLALGISYGRGYSRMSQSIHPLLGSHDYHTNQDYIRQIKTNFSYLSIITMHIMNLSYKIMNVEDPEGLQSIMGKDFQKSEASHIMDNLSKKLSIGDLVLTVWSDFAEITDEHKSEYGYKAYKIKYLSRSPLPEFTEDWVEAQNIMATIMTQANVRSFFERNISSKMNHIHALGSVEKILEQPDEKLMEYLKRIFSEMHNSGLLIPMLVDSGFLKKKKYE